MKDLEVVNLYDVYGSLLTEHQRILLEGYYLFDLSFSELAENHGGSRQSVYDAVKKARQQLVEYEKALNVVKKNEELKKFCDDLSKKDEELSNKLRDIINKKGE